MMTSLSPAMKQHIETYIDEIDQNNVIQSIYSCPIEILCDYINILDSIDVKPHIITRSYVSIALYIASICGGAHLSDVRIENFMSREEIQSFEFLVNKQYVNSIELEQELQRLCPSNEVLCSISMSPYVTTIKVSVRNIKSAHFRIEF